LTKAIGVPPDQLFYIAARSPRSRRAPLRPRILGRLRRMVRRTDTFFYPRPSFGAFVEKLAEGLDIRCGAEITRVHVEHNRIVALEIDGAGRIPCDDLVLAVPGHTALPLFDAPDEVRRSAGAIRYRDLICAVLFFETDHVLPKGYCSAIGQEIFGSFWENKHYVPDCCPPNQTWVGFYIPCARGDSIWNTPDEEIARRVLADFRRYYPGVTPSTAKILRIPRFTVILDADLEVHLRTVHRYLSSFENLHLPDCLMPIRGDKTYAAIDEALRVAAEITGARPRASMRPSA
jgi:protoporphyrinogen oxidase